MPTPDLPDDSGPIPTSGLGRSARLLGVPLSVAGRKTVGLGKRMLGGDSEQISNEMREQTAQQLFRVLGQLKGGAMKFGQALSLMEAGLPEEIAAPYREQLSRLQDAAPPMPLARVESVLSAELGANWRDLISGFSRRPAAAASIGQVHTATWVPTGEPIAVKVQYPGADDALRSDLAQITRLAGMVAPLTGGLDVKALSKELAERIAEEVDYLHEAENQRAAAAAFANDRQLVVPNVIAATRRVLVSQWLSGTKLAEVATWSADERDRVGAAYVRCWIGGPKLSGLLHADPHPGNFLVLPEGKLGVIDWGLAAQLPQGLPEPMGRLMRVAMTGDADALADGMRDEGILVGDTDAQLLLSYLEPFIEPAREESFHFSREWLRSEFQRIQSEARGNDAVANLNVPPVYALIHRVWLGGMSVLAQLDCRVPVRSILDEYLPGFARQ